MPCILTLASNRTHIVDSRRLVNAIACFLYRETFELKPPLNHTQTIKESWDNQVLRIGGGKTGCGRVPGLTVGPESQSPHLLIFNYWDDLGTGSGRSNPPILPSSHHKQTSHRQEQTDGRRAHRAV